MATAVRPVRTISSDVSGHDEMLEEPRPEPQEDLEAWVRGLLSDDCSGGGIGEEMLEITDSAEDIVLSIAGRDRRLRFH